MLRMSLGEANLVLLQACHRLPGGPPPLKQFTAQYANRWWNIRYDTITTASLKLHSFTQNFVPYHKAIQSDDDSTFLFITAWQPSSTKEDKQKFEEHKRMYTGKDLSECFANLHMTFDKEIQKVNHENRT
jgi:hypothetical protein